MRSRNCDRWRGGNGRRRRSGASSILDALANERGLGGNIEIRCSFQKKNLNNALVEALVQAVLVLMALQWLTLSQQSWSWS